MMLPFLTRASHDAIIAILRGELTAAKQQADTERAKTWQLTQDILCLRREGFSVAPPAIDITDQPKTVDEEDAFRAEEEAERTP